MEAYSEKHGERFRYDITESMMADYIWEQIRETFTEVKLLIFKHLESV